MITEKSLIQNIKTIKFGTGGFRGVIGADFNKENVKIVAQALSEIIKREGSGKPVVIGFDNRFGSDFFARWMAQTIAANGIKCLLYSESMPSPAVMTAVRDEGLDYGIMITASHNSYIFNGVKLFLKGGVDADVEFTSGLEQMVNSLDNVNDMSLNEAAERGLITEYSNKQKYLDNIAAFLLPKVSGVKIKILYDNLCGVGAKCIEPLLKRVGVTNYTVLHAEHDAFFGFCAPNPTEETMNPLKKIVVTENYDYAMATDSDSDRLGIIDENGNYVSSNDILACIYYYLIKFRKMSGDIVKNCATSVLVDKVAAAAGYKCHEVDVGFKNISSGIRRYDALIGGESSGGLTVKGYIFGKDSVFSSLLFCEMVTVMGKPVSEIVKEVRNFAGYNYVFMEDEIRLEDIEGYLDFAKNSTPDFKRKVVKRESYNNNVKFYFEDDCWALLRLSGTEPVFRVFVEFESEEAARENIEKLREFIYSKTGAKKIKA